MRLHRFYINEDIGSRDELRIVDESLIHQVRDVFRLGATDSIIAFCDDGLDYIFEIELVTKKELKLKKIKSEKNFIPERKVVLLIALIKKDNFELVLEKATEIGVTHFVPVVTERTLSKNINFERAQKIIREASEQCGRGDIPTLGDVASLDSVLKEYSNLIAFDISGKVFESQKSDVEILIGPEGGWSDKDIDLFKEKKVNLLKLGDTTLRAETAAIVASAKIILG